MEPRSLLLNCPYCRARVAAEVHSDLGHFDDEHPEICVSLARCPTCKHPLVAYEEDCGIGGDSTHPQRIWSVPLRLWPEPEVDLPAAIPAEVAESMKEARVCLSTGTYTACVAMTGRGIEGLCHHFRTKKTQLFDGLKELRDREIIDKRLYEWADELRKHRNLAAHASGAAFQRQDAEDIFDFALAICDYVFVLSKKFEEFTKRTAAKQASSQP